MLGFLMQFGVCVACETCGVEKEYSGGAAPLCIDVGRTEMGHRLGLALDHHRTRGDACTLHIVDEE